DLNLCDIAGGNLPVVQRSVVGVIHQDAVDVKRNLQVVEAVDGNHFLVSAAIGMLDRNAGQALHGQGGIHLVVLGDFCLVDTVRQRRDRRDCGVDVDVD